MVITCLPATSLTGTEQDRTASRFTITVQAPHKPSPQPNFVPVRPRSLRSTHSNMRPSSTFTLAGLPLRVKEMVRSMKTSPARALDRKSTRLNSSHLGISYAVFCLKKKKKQTDEHLSRDPSFHGETTSERVTGR